VQRDDIIRICQQVIDICTSYCLDRKGNSDESQAFFNRLIADFKRY
jgi:hypothetical protein